MHPESTTEYNEIHKTIIQWGMQSLAQNGFTLTSKQPENIQETPWSYVVRFSTNEGFIYLKHTPKMIGLEATIIKKFHDQFHISVPEVIAENSELNCFLMKDAGIPLRTILKKEFKLSLVLQTIDQFTSMQVCLADHTNIFIDAGVPDWRLDKMPDLFNELLLQKKILAEDGLLPREITELQKLRPTIAHLCKKLSAYSIRETIVQPDFNDNNILIDEDLHQLTIIDLGEIVIAHPFFSLLNFLEQMKKHYFPQPKDGTYLMIRDVCLKNFMVYECKEKLIQALSITHVLSHLYGALAYYRLMLACDRIKLTTFYGEGRLRHQLRTLLKVFTVIDNENEAL